MGGKNERVCVAQTGRKETVDDDVMVRGFAMVDSEAECTRREGLKSPTGAGLGRKKAAEIILGNDGRLDVWGMVTGDIHEA